MQASATQAPESGSYERALLLQQVQPGTRTTCSKRVQCVAFASLLGGMISCAVATLIALPYISGDPGKIWFVVLGASLLGGGVTAIVTRCCQKA